MKFSPGKQAPQVKKRFFHEQSQNRFVTIYVQSDKNKKVRIGTSGFGYDDWLGNFYPQFCPRADYLRFYASVFSTVEIDATYYRIPGPDIVRRWHNQTPDNFVFTAKFPSSVTHRGSLTERIDNARHFITSIEHLENKLGPLLMQFPYGFKPDKTNHNILSAVVDAVPPHIRFAVEVRNRKWLTERLYEMLRKRNIGLVQVDHPWMPRRTEITADFNYIRLLGDRKKIASDFSYVRDERLEDLNWWSQTIEEFSRSPGEVYVYVNNHYTGHSPSAAGRLKELIEKKG